MGSLFICLIQSKFISLHRQLRKTGDIEDGKKDLPKTITEILKDLVLDTAKNTSEKVTGEIVTDEISSFLKELYKKTKEKYNKSKH